MEKRFSWKFTGSTATLKFPAVHVPKIQYRLHSGPQLVPLLNQMNSIHVLPSYFTEDPF